MTVFQTPRSTVALRPARFEDGAIALSAVRTPSGPELTVPVQAIGLDPAGTERVLAAVDMTFNAGNSAAEVTLSLPPELRNRVSRFAVAGARSAGAVTLTDDALRRREVALIAGGGEAEGLDLLSPLYYLREALSPTADLIDGTLADVLQANPDVVVLADVANLAGTEEDSLLQWVEDGGLLLRCPCACVLADAASAARSAGESRNRWHPFPKALLSSVCKFQMMSPSPLRSWRSLIRPLRIGLLRNWPMARRW